MKVIINFSHPLTEDQRAYLNGKLGPFDEIRKLVQFDLSADSLRNQVFSVFQEALEECGGIGNVAAIVPPSLSAAAYWVAVEVALCGLTDIPAVWLRRDGDGVPPRFVVGGVE